MKMPAKTAERIRRKVVEYATDPASQANNIRMLQGQDNTISLRVGDWRVIMEDGAVLAVLKVGPRGSVYD